jgi:ABC-2 type transport system permease protein
MGTFGRMLTTPVNASQVLTGKVLGIIVTGFLQVSILILASSLLFNLDWGSPIAVVALIFSVVFAATGWGILIASFVKQNWQASALGSAVMLIFGILGGTFIPVSEFTETIRWIGKITPNYWAIQGFTRLALGETPADLIPVLVGLILMGLVLMMISALVARKRWSDIGFSRGS